MDWILLLAVATFVLVVAFLIWNQRSTRRHQKYGDKAEGIGGKSDPISGNTDNIRPAHELRAAMDEAADEPANH